MENFCTNQWLLVKYPPGVGGKFFISILFLFDEVAHWEPKVAHGEKTYDEWFEACWPTKTTAWVIHEPNGIWNNFYSRRWPRNETLTVEQFNELAKKESHEYFHECWNKGKIIVEHWHKTYKPAYFQNARWMEILVDREDLPQYQKMIMKKLLIWNDETKTAINTVQHPDWAPNEEIKKLILQYKNPHTISGYASEQDIFDNWFLQQTEVKSFVAVDDDPTCDLTLKFGDLIDKDRFFSIIDRLENYFSQQQDHDRINQFHDIWLARSGIGA